MGFDDFMFEKILPIIVIILLGMICFIPVFIVDAMYNNPISAEKARIYCNEEGFVFADDFRRIPFTTEPLGVKCKTLRIDIENLKSENGLV